MPVLRFPESVTLEREFYGRKADLARVEQSLLGGSRIPFVILGERRVGKTSFQTVSVGRLINRPERKIISLDIPPFYAIQSMDSLALEILQSLCVHLSRPIAETGLVQPGEPFQLPSYGAFLQAFRNLLQLAPDTTFVICIDELDAIFKQMEERGKSTESDRILGLLDMLVEQGSQLPVVLVVTMTSLPEKIRQAYPSVTLFQTCEYIQVAPLMDEETRQMIHGLLCAEASVEQSAEKYLLELSGGHPYLLKLLLKYLTDAYCRPDTHPQLTREMVKKILPDAVDDFRTRQIMDNIYRVHFNPIEQSLVLLLALREKPIPSGQLENLGPAYPIAARELVRRGYLNFEHSTAFSWNIAYLDHWLRSWDYYESEIDRLGVETLSEDLEVELIIYEANREVTLLGESLDLTPQEYQVLSLMCRSDGLVTRDQISDELWPKARGDVNDAAIDAIIKRLRGKLGDDRHQQRFIETRPGIGFILHRCRLITKD